MKKPFSVLRDALIEKIKRDQYDAGYDAAIKDMMCYVAFNPDHSFDDMFYELHQLRKARETTRMTIDDKLRTASSGQDS